MSDTPYGVALAAAKKELASKKALLHRLENEVRRLESTVRALTALTGQPDEIDVTSGITEAVKQAIKMQDPTGLYPTTVRLRLEEAGFPFEDMKNPMPTIHSVLKRLEQADIIRRGRGDNGKTAFFWNNARRVRAPKRIDDPDDD